MLDGNFCIVDLETTGLSPTSDRIIEIGAIVVQGGQWVQSYSSFVDPERPLPPFISDLTGIQPEQLKKAPTFADIADEVLELFQEGVLVAHNARFDFGFLRNEMERLEIPFRVKPLCTVRLSRRLFPEVKGHGLDRVIQRMGISCPRRHRAFDDTHAVWEFLQKIQKQFSPEQVDAAWQSISKRPSLPSGVSTHQIDGLPREAGVYIFYDKKGGPLYVGKSVHIKERVLSHFTSDYSRSAEMAMCRQCADIEAIPTGGELGALLLEAHLIKKLQPLYNRRGRECRQLVVARRSLNSTGFLTARPERITHLEPHEMSDILGVFRSLKQAKNFLQERAKENGLCPKLLTLEKGKGVCFSYQLKKCSGACAGKISAVEYNLRYEQAFDDSRIPHWPFSGPIQVREMHDIFVLDQWCLVGKLPIDELNQTPLELEDYIFDYESYKILKNYLRNPKNRKKIQAFRRPPGWGNGQIALQWS